MAVPLLDPRHAIRQQANVQLIDDALPCRFLSIRCVYTAAFLRSRAEYTKAGWIGMCWKTGVHGQPQTCTAQPRKDGTLMTAHLGVCFRAAEAYAVVFSPQKEHMIMTTVWQHQDAQFG